MAQKKVTLSVDEKVYRDFQRYCEDNAVMLSKKVELIMVDIMEQDKEINKMIEKTRKEGKIESKNDAEKKHEEPNNHRNYVG